MRLIFSALLATFTMMMPLQAKTTHELTLSDVNVAIVIDEPEGYQELDHGQLDLVFQDPQDLNHKLAFHYFKDTQFDFRQMGEVLDYIHWVTGNLLGDAKKYQTNLRTSKDHATYSFATKTEEGKEIYCCMYIGKIENDLVFASIAISSQSLDAAADDCALFVNNVYWKNL